MKLFYGALVVTWFFSAPSGVLADDIASSEITQCANEKNNDIRLLCYDRLFRGRDEPSVKRYSLWSISESIDPISDSPTVFAEIKSRDRRMSVYIRCKGGFLSMYAAIVSQWPSNNDLRAAMRRDQEPPVRSTWIVSQDRYLAYPQDGSEVAKWALKASAFVLRLDSEGKEYTGVFEFGDTSPISTKLRAACPNALW